LPGWQQGGHNEHSLFYYKNLQRTEKSKCYGALAMEEQRAMSYLAVEGKVHPEKPEKKKKKEKKGPSEWCSFIC